MTMGTRPTLRELVAVLNERVGNLLVANKSDHEEIKESIKILSNHCNHEVELLNVEVEHLKGKFKIQEAINKAQKTTNEEKANSFNRKLRDLSIVAATSVSVTTIILNLPKIIQLLKGN